jgi:SAM-dependent methyltransferase
LEQFSGTEIRRRYTNDDYATSHADLLKEDRSFEHIAKQRARWLASRMPPGPLLELGPAKGYFLAAVRKLGFQPTAVEPSPSLARRLEFDFGLDVRQGFVDEVDLPQGHYRAICLFHVLEHAAYPIQMLRLLRDLLAEEGFVFIEVPNIGCAMAKRRGVRWQAVHPRELHVSHFEPSTLESLVERSGLEVVEIDTIAPWRYLPLERRLGARAVGGYLFRARWLRTLRTTHPEGFDNLRVVARRKRR